MSGKAYTERHHTKIIISPKLVLAVGGDHEALEIKQIKASSDVMKVEGRRFADYLFEYGASGFLDAMRERLVECQKVLNGRIGFEQN